MKSNYRNYNSKSGEKLIFDISLSLMPDNKSILIGIKDSTNETKLKLRIDKYISLVNKM